MVRFYDVFESFDALCCALAHYLDQVLMAPGVYELTPATIRNRLMILPDRAGAGAEFIKYLDAMADERLFQAVAVHLCSFPTTERLVSLPYRTRLQLSQPGHSCVVAATAHDSGLQPTAASTSAPNTASAPASPDIAPTTTAEEGSVAERTGNPTDSFVALCDALSPPPDNCALGTPTPLLIPSAQLATPHGTLDKDSLPNASSATSTPALDPADLSPETEEAVEEDLLHFLQEVCGPEPPCGGAQTSTPSLPDPAIIATSKATSIRPLQAPKAGRTGIRLEHVGSSRPQSPSPPLHKAPPSQAHRSLARSSSTPSTAGAREFVNLRRGFWEKSPSRTRSRSYSFAFRPPLTREEAKRRSEAAAAQLRLYLRLWATDMIKVLTSDGYLALSDAERSIWRSVAGHDVPREFTQRDLGTSTGRAAFAKMALRWAKCEMTKART